jgi:hypothetical protein
VANFDVSAKMMKTLESYVLKLNHALGYDFNTVELAIRDGIPYAIDFCNPAPDAEVTSVGQENFEWVVENAANYAIERAKAQKPGQDNLTWGTFIKDAVGAQAKPAPAKKATTAKKTTTAKKATTTRKTSTRTKK